MYIFSFFLLCMCKFMCMFMCMCKFMCKFSSLIHSSTHLLIYPSTFSFLSLSFQHSASAFFQLKTKNLTLKTVGFDKSNPYLIKPLIPFHKMFNSNLNRGFWFVCKIFFKIRTVSDCCFNISLLHRK